MALINTNGSVFYILLFLFTNNAFASTKYFSCSTSKGTISVISDSANLVYRMKNTDGSVFQYSSLAPEYTGYDYNHYSRFQTDYLKVGFEKGGFKYELFSNSEDGKDSRGITVVNLSNNKECTYNCINVGTDKLSDLTSKLSCDKNNALGCD